MINLKLAVRNKKLLVEADLSENHGPSSSGKSIIVASSQGPVPIPDHPGFMIVMTVYRSRQPSDLA
jgi:hypothetical protein